MKQQNKPFIVFNAGTDTGVDKIPLNSYVQIHNDGSGNSRLIYVTSVSGLNDSSTITDLLALTANYDSVLLNEIPDSLSALDLVSDTTPVLGGNLDADDFVIDDVTLKGKSNALIDAGSISTNTTIDFSTNKVQKVTVTADVQLDFTVNSTQISGTYTKEELTLFLHGADENTVTFADNIIWDTEIPYFEYSTVILKFITYDNGVNYYGSLVWGTGIGAWDISSGLFSFVSTFTPTVNTNSVGISVHPSGDKMIVLDYSGDTLEEYSMTTPWDVGSISHVKTKSTTALLTSPYAIFIKPDGTKIYLFDYTGATVKQFSLTTPWDINTIVTDNKTLVLELSVKDIGFSPDGVNFFYSTSLGDFIYRYTCSTPWDISTATTASDSLDFSSYQNIFGFDISPDGINVYITRESILHHWVMSTPWILSTATPNSYYSDSTSNSSQVCMSPDGKKFILMHRPTTETISSHSL